MKKLLICMILCLAAVPSIYAQTAVRGRVVDKNGIPIPGARVSVKGNLESALTDFDGVYRLITDEDVKKLTVDYVGFNTRKVKVEDAEEIALTKTTIWNDVTRNNWMVTFQMAFPEFSRVNDKVQPLMPSYGAMIGWCRKIGGYVKILWRSGVTPDVYYSEPEKLTELWMTGEHDSAYKSLTAGFIFRLMSPFHIYAGAGAGRWDVSYEVSNMGYIKYDLHGCSQLNLTLDVGVAFKIRYFMLTGGVLFNPTGNGVVGNFGIGVSF